MKKNVLKIITTIIIISIIIPNTVFAEDFGLGDLDGYKGSNTDSTELTSMVGNILGVIRAVGTVVSVVILIGIGIRYMLASVEEKADYKKSLIPYIAGAAILFTGTTIPQLIYNIVNEI